MKSAGIMWLALAITVGVPLFLLKYKVQALENELTQKHEQAARDRAAIRVLEAEWAYLNDPGRLERLSKQHLNLATPASGQVVTISSLPMRPERLVTPMVSATVSTLTTAPPVAPLTAATPWPQIRPAERAGSLTRLQLLLSRMLAGTVAPTEPTP